MTEYRSSCPVCDTCDAVILAPPCTYVRHMDFLPLQHQPDGLRRCHACGCVFMADTTTIREIRTLYTGNDYARKKKTEHRVHGGKDGQADRTTYRAIADFLAGEYPAERPRILDIGCFDGKLLSALEHDCHEAEMQGFDVSPAIADIFPDKPNYTYWCGDLSLVEGPFDLICVVNTLMYVEDCTSFMRELRRLLADEGRLFVLTPNTAINPCFLTLGDQMLYFSPTNLTSFLVRFGYEAEISTSAPAFPRSILALCQRSSGGKPVANADSSFDAAVAWLTETALKVRQTIEQARADNGTNRVCILGGAHNATWAFNTADGRIDSFVDENPARAGTTFHDRPVLHPRELTSDDLLLLPYGETAEAIRRKFETLYEPRLVTI